jgi:16S rRNA (cytosine967-C5)-methyltransferase
MMHAVKKRPLKGRGPRDLALDLVCDAERPGTRVDDRLRGLESRTGLNPKDRAFVRELTFGTLRWRGKLDGVLCQHLSESADKLPPVVRNILRLGAYQILLTDRIPDWAAVDEAVKQVRRRGFGGLTGLVNGVLRGLARTSVPPVEEARIEDASSLAVAESHPEWMVRRWVDRLGLDAAVRICKANNSPGPLSVRVNRRRATLEILRDAFQEVGVEVVKASVAPDMLNISGGPPVRELPGFRQGWFAVQDEGAALVGHFLGVGPGERVWDVCAGPGGKAVHIAELMDDDGFVLATDTNAHQLSRLAENSARMGIRSICPVQADAAKSVVRSAGFDAVLVDAPCSGLGVLRRHPEAKWNKNEGDILRLGTLQAKMLKEASQAVRPGGRLVYCVCSNEEEETRRIVKSFEASKEGAEFQREDLAPYAQGRIDSIKRFVGPDGCFSILPGDAGTDGFFAALWERTPL